MKLEPIKRTRRRPVALLETQGPRKLRVTTVDGVNDWDGRRPIENALAKLKGHACYVEGRLQELRFTTPARSWVLHTWKGREARMTHVPSGVNVSSLRTVFSDAPDPFVALLTLVDWLEGFGVGAASLSSMSWNLLRASLTDTVTVFSDHGLAERAFFGPRQEVRDTGHFFGFMAIDMRAAYPSSMAAEPYALTLHEVDKTTELDPNVAGLAAARVHVPDYLGAPPLPVRVMEGAIQFQRGDVRGVWPWRELAAAQSVGCDVEIVRSFAPRREADLFGPWWGLARTGRDLPNGADVGAKAVANCTWGQCAMTGDGAAEVHWADDAGNEPFVVPLAARNLPHLGLMHLAAETTSRVRTRLLTDVLYSPTFPPLHVDTDGVIVGDRSPLPENSGNGFGQWDVKAMIYELDLRGPQFYRWTCSDCEVEHAKWHTVASGIPAESAHEWFRKNAPRRGTRVSFAGDYDVVLPPGDAADVTNIAKLLAEARFYGGGR